MSTKILTTTKKEDPAVEPFEMLFSKREEYLLQAVRQCKIADYLIEDIYPCSPSQVLYTDIAAFYGNRSSAKCISEQFLFSVTDECDFERLKMAWDRVIAENQALRIRILKVSDQYLQVVVREAVEWQQVLNMNEHVQTDKNNPFKLGKQLSRFAVTSSPDQFGAYQVLWTASHALYDMWSGEPIFTRLVELYQNSVSADISRPLPNQFIRYLMGTNSTDTQRFWTDHFKGLSTKPFLPCPNPGAYASSSMTSEFLLMENTDEDTTTAIKLYAAFAIIASKDSGSRDVVLQMLRTGRDLPIDNIECMIAPTLATIPVRIPIDWGIECASFLRSLLQRLLLLMDYQYVDWVTIANLSAEGNAGCQAAIPFAVHQHRVDVIEECSKIGLKLKSLEMSGWNVPILVDFLISSSHITGNICFDPIAFRPEYIDSLLNRTETVYLQLCQFEAGICLKDLQISF